VRGNDVSPGALRVEVHARGLARAAAAELSGSDRPCVVYAEDTLGGHGNFLTASYRRIVANAAWARRLGKTYTGSRHLPRAADRWRGELESAASSDALLMNVFCYPGVLRRREVCALLGIEPGLRPEFGVRAELPMRNGEVDRTELDMRLGSTLAEAKLAETGFGRASRERLLRYTGVESLFSIDDLPRSGTMFAGYQIVRGLMAAVQNEDAYVVLVDGRRSDLVEVCFRVLGAVRSAEVRHRLRLRTWQEVAAGMPSTVQRWLAEKYGIETAQRP
jgi:hypothetical protein